MIHKSQWICLRDIFVFCRNNFISLSKSLLRFAIWDWWPCMLPWSLRLHTLGWFLQKTTTMNTMELFCHSRFTQNFLLGRPCRQLNVYLSWVMFGLLQRLGWSNPYSEVRQDLKNDHFQKPSLLSYFCLIIAISLNGPQEIDCRWMLYSGVRWDKRKISFLSQLISDHWSPPLIFYNSMNVSW